VVLERCSMREEEEGEEGKAAVQPQVSCLMVMVQGDWRQVGFRATSLDDLPITVAVLQRRAGEL
jgi:hypothetical protein